MPREEVGMARSSVAAVTGGQRKEEGYEGAGLQ